MDEFTAEDAEGAEGFVIIQRECFNAESAEGKLVQITSSAPYAVKKPGTGMLQRRERGGQARPEHILCALCGEIIE